MSATTKKVLILIAVAFAIYAIFTAPNQSADAVGTAWDTLKDGANAVGDFFDALIAS